MKQKSIKASLFYNNDPLLILRFFAAFLVFTTHCAEGLFNAQQFEFFGVWRGAAHCGMIIFFTLSGYLMGKAFISERYKINNREIKKFYTNRLNRIMPLALVLALVFIAMTFPDNLGLGVYWSLGVELQYYFFAPFIFYLGNKIFKKNQRNILGIFLACFLLTFINRWLEKRYFDDLFFTLWYHLPYFLIGFSTNYFSSKPGLKFSQLRLSAGFVILFIFLATLQHGNQQTALHLTGFLTCAIIILFEDFKWRAEIYSKKINIYTIFQALGVLSYGFYLWHSFLGLIYIRAFNPQFNDVWSYLKHVLVLGVITLIASFVSYVFIELPFLNRKKL